MAANFTVPPIIGQLKLNNGRVATFYETERGSYERALASGATPVGPPPAGTTVVNGNQVSTTEDVPPPAEVVTTDQSQATSAQNGFNVGIPLPDETGAVGSIRRNPETGELYNAGGLQAPTSGGVGAGTSKNSANSIGSDNNAKPTNSSARAAINASTASLNRLIPTEPNQLDQYASYTYSLSWYLMTTEQFNDMMARQRPTISSWKLLMQSGGAASAGRSQAFSLDYYMDDLEIITKSSGGGTLMAHSATDIKFKVVEPNGITLIESIFNAVQSMYKNSKQSQTNTSNNGAPVAETADVGATFNYLQAHYCMVIQFYGYDKDGNLVSPIKGASNAGASASGYGQVANIIKYYPFRLTDIKFQIANRAIEYAITAKPIGQSYAFTTDRGTIPHQFNMTGQTVEQLLNGPYVVDSTGGSAGAADPGARQDKPDPTLITRSVNDTSVNAGVNAFGNFTGDTQNPNAVVAP
jgi:hypothetical protein